MSELKKRAATSGATAEQIEQIDDSDDPKAAAIDLLLAAQAAVPEETPRDVRLERRADKAEGEAAYAVAQAAEAAEKVEELESALNREKEAGAAARKAASDLEQRLADAEARLTAEQGKSGACVVS